MNTRNVLALHVPVNYKRPPEQTLPLYKEAIRRIGELPGVEQVAVGTLVPWREAGAFFAAQFMVEGYAKADGEDDPRGQFRTVSPGFFAALGVPIIAGRDFNAGDRSDSEKVVIVSQSLAQRLFPNQDAVNRQVHWTDPVMKFIDVSTGPRRIVGVAADIDDENVIPGAGDGRCITRWIRRSAAAGCSCTRGPIRTRWCRRSRRSSATCRRNSRWSRRRRSTTCAPRCWRRTG